MMKFQIHPLTEQDATSIVRWEYPPPYDLYNGSGGDTSSFFNPESPYYAVTDENGSLIGFLATGIECQVSGGDYSTPAVDIGIGLHPGSTGHGLGRTILKQFFEEISSSSDHPPLLRATIAAFNQRSLKTFVSLGFTESARFRTSLDWIIVTLPFP
jgi:L-amino acid N-acyltransferase YncA